MKLDILGLSTFHEIFEYLGAVFLGQGEGFLFYGSGDADLFDTQKDFVNNPFTKEDLEGLDLPDVFPVTVYRTYTIIADGRLQTKKLVVSDLSKETINTLGPIITMRNDGKYIVDFI